MGDKELESKPDEPKEDGYKVITYTNKTFPCDFRNLIIAPFLNSLRYGNDLFKLIDKEGYYLAYGKYIDSLLNKSNIRMTLAILEDGSVLGWCLWEWSEPTNIVHYVWVKKEARRNGICKSLLPLEFGVITHITNKGLTLWNKYPDARLNPFI